LTAAEASKITSATILQTIIQSVKNLYATMIDGIITSLLLILVIFMIFKIIKQ